MWLRGDLVRRPLLLKIKKLFAIKIVERSEHDDEVKVFQMLFIFPKVSIGIPILSIFANTQLKV